MLELDDLLELHIPALARRVDEDIALDDLVELLEEFALRLFLGLFLLALFDPAQPALFVDARRPRLSPGP
jgi:hypothetical protein